MLKEDKNNGANIWLLEIEFVYLQSKKINKSYD